MDCRYLRWKTLLFWLILGGVIASFVYLSNLDPPYYNKPPPQFDSFACAACEKNHSSPSCSQVFPPHDGNYVVSRVCGTNCCCPSDDPGFLSVRCSQTFTPACQCRYERLCGESCFLNEGLIPLICGLFGCGILVLWCVCYICWKFFCNQKNIQSPPSPIAMKSN